MEEREQSMSLMQPCGDAVAELAPAVDT
jgi:hypothetical protein